MWKGMCSIIYYQIYFTLLFGCSDMCQYVWCVFVWSWLKLRYSCYMYKLYCPAWKPMIDIISTPHVSRVSVLTTQASYDKHRLLRVGRVKPWISMVYGSSRPMILIHVSHKGIWKRSESIGLDAEKPFTALWYNEKPALQFVIQPSSHERYLGAYR